ncbi:unnamed protein product [Orchesella dallaii]|uniref:Protein kinase domain-containing protein n=1 Tax=Orchesella dallaii TaxID=48710 RepID=A0ABP1QAP8_9HEXA
MERLYTIVAFVCLLNLEGVEVANSNSLKVSPTKSMPPFIKTSSKDSNISYVIKAVTEVCTDMWIKLRCEADEPIRWIIWKLDTETDDFIKIEKRTEQNNTLFVSELTYNLTKEDFDVDGNFSCLFEKHWTSGRFDSNSIFRNMTGVAVEIRQSRNESSCEIVISIIANKSLSYYYVGSSEDVTKNCTVLSYDLSSGISAVCRSKESKAKWKSCNDLDVCESWPLTLTTKDTRNCRGTSENHTVTSTPSGFPDSYSSPFVIYCPDKGETQWDSFEVIYPNTGLQNWEFPKPPLYYNTIDAALNRPSIAIVITSDTTRQIETLLNNALSSNNTLAFAENETVEFACVAVRYLYMREFHWRIGYFADNSVPPDSPNQTYEINKTQNLIIVKRNITISKIYAWISCQGQIWNSEEQRTAKINISVTDATPPSGGISHVKEDQNDIFTCKYKGWPKPKVTWIFTNNVTTNPPSDAVEDNHRAPHASWSETRIIPTLSRGYTVTCKLENLKDKQEYSYTKQEEGSRTTLVVVIISSVLVCVITLIFFIVYWRYRKRLELYAQRQHLTTEEIDEFYKGAKNNSTTYEALVLPYNPDFEIDLEQLGLDGSILGSGQFGLVLKGSIGPLPVAVKTIKPVADIIYLKSLLSELKILQYVGPHRNIVNLIGANTANIKKREVFLVLDYCPNGNLVQFLRQCRDRFVNFFSNSSSPEQKV